METCQNCAYYNLIDKTKGNCFGYEVEADMPSEKCPLKAFELKNREENNL